MKTILEFTHPEDDDDLRYAMNGIKAIYAISDMRLIIRSWEKHDGTNPEAVIERLKQCIFEALTDCGEDT